MNFPGTLVHVHAFQIPLLVWLLLFAGGTFASAFYLTFDGIFIITGLSLLGCLALNIAWRYLRPSHPLAKKHAQFLQLRANVSACGRGPTRALQAQQLQDFRDFFQAFIKAARETRARMCLCVCKVMDIPNGCPFSETLPQFGILWVQLVHHEERFFPGSTALTC